MGPISVKALTLTFNSNPIFTDKGFIQIRARRRPDVEAFGRSFDDRRTAVS